MSKTNDAYLEREVEKEIIIKWYQALDADYHENDPESGCQICYEALQLGLIGERELEEA